MFVFFRLFRIHLFVHPIIDTLAVSGAVPISDLRCAVSRVPADCRVLSCTDLMVDESSLTGEGALVEKTSSVLLFNEAAADLPIAERTNIIFMVRGGCRCIYRKLRCGSWVEAWHLCVL